MSEEHDFSGGDRGKYTKTLDEKVNEFAARSYTEILDYAREHGIRGFDYREEGSPQRDCFMSRVLTHYTGETVWVGVYRWGEGRDFANSNTFPPGSIVPDLIWDVIRALNRSDSTFPEDLIERVSP